MTAGRTAPHVPGVGAASIRVALAATAVVGAAYLLVAVAVVLIVTRNLTSQLDADLQSHASPHRDASQIIRAGPAAGSSRPHRPPRTDRVITWTIHADGTRQFQQPDARPAGGIPARRRIRRRSRSARISVRIAGTAVRDEYVVVARRVGSVDKTQYNLVLAELLIGPILLAVVFLGAVAIGRRVAAPIEHARQRQLEFTADASHELRTPLSVIEAQTSLALAAGSAARVVPQGLHAGRRREQAHPPPGRGPAVARPLRRR